MEQKRLVIILADISGYTEFMLENRTSAVHGQACINSLIESILTEVDIPLTLQEIEGDAVFLYATDPGHDGDWQRTMEEVSRKIAKFFDAFIAGIGITSESTPCACAICRNAEKLGMKVIIHVGEAMFHEVAGRRQISGPDVILAHKLLKNSLDSKEYLLLTEAAYTAMGAHLPGTFESRHERYDGFETVPLRVRFLEKDFIDARDTVYKLTDSERQIAVDGYIKWARPTVLKASIDQFLRPTGAHSWWQRILMVIDALITIPMFHFYWRREIPKQQGARGKRRER